MVVSLIPSSCICCGMVSAETISRSLLNSLIVSSNSSIVLSKSNNFWILLLSFCNSESSNFFKSPESFLRSSKSITSAIEPPLLERLGRTSFSPPTFGTQMNILITLLEPTTKAIRHLPVPP